jgi:hypothetical protein
MMMISNRFGVLALLALLLAMILVAACDDDDETEVPDVTATGQPTVEPTVSPKPTDTPTAKTPEVEPVRITLGMITDLTGPGATALEWM